MENRIESLLRDIQRRLGAVERAIAKPEPEEEKPVFVGTKKAAEILGVTERAIYGKAQRGDIGCVKVGHTLYFNPQELARYTRGEK